MSTINPIQNQPTANETTFCGSCLQLVYDMVNKVKDVVMAILQTILPCFFSSASSIDPNAVTQLNTGTVGQTPVDAVRHAQGQIAQQPIRVSADGIAQPAATPSGGSSAPAQPSVSQEADQENHPLGGTHSSVVPQSRQLPLHEAVVVGGGGDAGDEVAGQVGADALAGGNPIAPGGDLVENPDEWLDVPFIPPRNDGGSFADQADQTDQDAFEVPPSAGGAAALLNALSPPKPQGPVILPPSLTDPIPPHVAPTGTGPASSSASSSVPPATDPAGMRQPWMLPNSKVDPSSGSSDYNTLDQNLLRAAAAAAASREHSNDVTGVGVTGVFDEVFGPDPSPDEAIPAAAASSASAVSIVPNLSNLLDTPEVTSQEVQRVKKLTEQIVLLRQSRIGLAQVGSSTKETADSKAQQGRRMFSIPQDQQQAGVWAAFAVAGDWMQDKGIMTDSEVDGDVDDLLRDAMVEHRKMPSGDPIVALQNNGLEFSPLGNSQSGSKWLEILKTRAQRRTAAAKRNRKDVKPVIVVLTNKDCTSSHTLYIIKDGNQWNYNLFSPNTPLAGNDPDLICQSFKGLDELRNAFDKNIEYIAYELIKYNPRTATREEFAAAAAALPPGGVHAVAAPNPDQDPNPYAEQP